MMLNLVGLRFRQRMAAQVAEQFILERIRGTTDVQPIPVDVRVGLLRAELIEVLRLMEVNIEEPLSLEELTRLVNLWQRHLQRMFKFYLNVSPTHCYLTLRLKRARDLLRTTNASIARVTTVCGFHSQCHFSKAYRAQFGYAPSMSVGCRVRRQRLAHVAARIVTLMKTKAAIASMCRRSSAGSTAGKPNIDDLITHTLPLERIHEGVVPMKRGESIRYHQVCAPTSKSIPVMLVPSQESFR